MKSPLFVLFPLTVSVCFASPRITLPPAAAPVSDEVLLAAIAEVETGNNPHRLGRRGERTHLQILPTTWRQYSRLPHTQAATNEAETERVARAYLAHIRTRLKARNLPETPFFIAAAWNAGPGWRRLQPRTVSYAERVANLVEASSPRSVQPAPVAVAKQEPLPASVPTIAVDDVELRLPLRAGTTPRPSLAVLFAGVN